MEAENASFWLPSHFLTDDDDHHLNWAPNNNKYPSAHNNNFDVFSSSLGLGLDSPVSSTETDKGDDELLSELTRYLAHSSLHPKPNTEKAWGYSTSPQSTLTGFGPWSNNNNNRSGFTSPNGGPSPPLTPELKNDAAWDLLYEAAGQVARLKMNAIAAQLNNSTNNITTTRGLLNAPRVTPFTPSTKSHHNFYDHHPYHNNNSQYEQVKRQGSGMWAQGQGRAERENWRCNHNHNHHLHQQDSQQHYGERRGCGGGGGGGAMGLPQSAWPPLTSRQSQHHSHRQGECGSEMRTMYLGGGGTRCAGVGSMGGGGGGMKRQSAGTGVFLPRRAGTTSPAQQRLQHQQPEFRKKPSGISTVLLPPRVVQALNLDLDDARFGSAGLPTDHDILMARRNAIMGQQRSMRNENTAAAKLVGHEVRLPNDWTY